MNKKLMAVAVAGALAAPAMAFAQASTVQLYGSLNVEYGFLSQADGVTAAATPYGRPSVDAFNSGASYVGVKGEEKIGGATSVWFQCESRARLGVDTAKGQAVDGFCGRNTALGLKGSFGNLFFGRWDSPLNLAQDGGRGGLLQTTGWTGVERLLLGDGGGAFAFDFARRNPNSVNYNTPSFNGLTGSFQYTSTNDGLSTASVATLVGKKGRAVSMAADYVSGPLTASLAYTKHDDNQAAAAFDGARDKAWLIGATYTFGPFKVGMIYTDLDGKAGTALAPTSVERKNWSLGAAWKITGPGTLRAGYVVAGDYKGTAFTGVTDTGAKAYNVGYSHSLSKRSTTSIYYSKVDNDRLGIHTFAGTSAAGVVSPGSSGSVISLQFQHKF